MEVYEVPPRLRNLHSHRRPKHHQCRRGPPPRFFRAAKNQTDRPADRAVKKTGIEIKEVWASNLEAELVKIHWALLNGFRVAALDTEFPGAPYVPPGVPSDYRARSIEHHYAVMKMNVDRLKIIQLGLTLTDEFGNFPDFGTGKRVVWEFNFSDFDVAKDECSKESVALLESHGIDFKKHKELGIDSARFARLILSAGLVGPAMTWITFQGGVDMAYLLKMIVNNCELPHKLEVFNAWIAHFFGRSVFDVKRMMTRCQLFGGLDKVAKDLKVEREAGESHRAGSDSLLTRMVFQMMRVLYFPKPEKTYVFAGQLHNLV